MSYDFKQTKRSASIKFHEQLYKLSMENNVPFIFDDEMNSVVSTSLYNDSFKDLMLKNDTVKTVYLNAKSREEQDKIVAFGNILLYPEYEHIYPCLDDVDLSYETIINKPYMDYQKQHHIETEDEINKRLFGDKSGWNKSESKVRRSISERLDALADRLNLDENDNDKEFE